MAGFEILPSAIMLGLLHLVPLALVVYLGIVRSQTVVPEMRTLTAWGLALILGLDQLRRSAYWIGKGAGYDVRAVTEATEVVLGFNLALIIFLLFVWDERLNGGKGARGDDGPADS